MSNLQVIAMGAAVVVVVVVVVTSGARYPGWGGS